MKYNKYSSVLLSSILSASSVCFVSCGTKDSVKSVYNKEDESKYEQLYIEYKNEKRITQLEKNDRSSIGYVLGLMEKEKERFGFKGLNFDLSHFGKDSMNVLVNLVKNGEDDKLANMIKLLVNIFGIELVGSPEKFKQVVPDYLKLFFNIANMEGVFSKDRTALLEFAKKFDVVVTFSVHFKINITEILVNSNNNFDAFNQKVDEKFNVVAGKNHFPKQYLADETNRVRELYTKYKVDFK